MRVVLAADHGGFALKEAIEKHLLAKKIEVLDVGTHSKEPVDYPVFARAAAAAVASGEAQRGVVVDGAGIGSAMVANKIPGVRAAMAFDLATTKNAREHNDANVLTLGAGYLTEEQALPMVDLFLSTDCTVDRHKKRVAMIDALDDRKIRHGGSSAPPAGPPREEALRSQTTPMSSPTPAPPPAAPASSPDFEALVGRITAILTTNPSLLNPATCGGTVAAGSPCTGCPSGGFCATRCPETLRSMMASAPAGSRISTALGIGGSGEVPKDMAKFIDHTLLKADATYTDIDKLCDEAAQFGFASVCVNPVYVKRCVERLKGSSSLVCTVIGFPLGATTKETKVLEARRAIREGAREIDMVIAIGALKSGDVRAVEDDIRAVAEAVHDGGAILKTIIETSLLTDDEKVAACIAARKARADYVKTSTGFSTGGATAHDVALMAQAVEGKLGVKASGGIRSAEDAKKMIAAGATRIGASVGVKIVKESKGEKVSAGGRGPVFGGSPNPSGAGKGGY